MLFHVELIASSFLDLISKQARLMAAVRASLSWSKMDVKISCVYRISDIKTPIKHLKFLLFFNESLIS